MQALLSDACFACGGFSAILRHFVTDPPRLDCPDGW